MELPDRLRIGLLQWEIHAEGIDHRARFCELLAKTVAARAHLVLVPEGAVAAMHQTNAASAVNDVVTYLGDTAATFGVWLVASDRKAFPESGCGVFDRRGNVQKPSPLRPDAAVFPGADLHCPPVFCSGPWKMAATCGVDLEYPEVYRWATLREANLFLLATRLFRPRQEIFTVLSRARAVENSAFFCAVNRVGKHLDEDHFGGSLIVDPSGKIMMRMGPMEGAVVVECAFEKVLSSRATGPDRTSVPVWPSPV